MEALPLPALRHQAPPHLPDHCDGYCAAFDICHAFDCKKVGLIPDHHNDLRDRFSDLASTAFTPIHVLGDPKIYTGCAVRGGKDKLKGSPYKDKGYLKECLLIRDLWVQGTNSINSMHVMNTDATSYQFKTPKKFLENTAEEKKKKYLDGRLKQSWHFTPFVA